MASTSDTRVAALKRSASGGQRAMVARKEFAHRGVAGFHVVRPHHGADAGRTVRQRYEPKPAVIEPINRDVAFALAAFAARPRKMRVQRGAIVFLVAALGSQAIAEEGIAARGIDDVVRRPLFGATVIVLGVHAHALRQKIHVAHAAAFDHRAPSCAARLMRISSNSERRT